MAENPYEAPDLPDTPPAPPGYIIDPVTGLPVPDPQPSDAQFAPGQDLPPGYRQPDEPVAPPPVEAPVIVPPSNLPNHIERPQPDDEIIDAADGEISEASPVDGGIVDEGEVAMGGGLNVNIQGVLDAARNLDGGDGALPPEAREATGSVFDGMREAAGHIREIGEQVLDANPAHDDIYEAAPAEVHEAEVAAPDTDEDPADDPYDTDQ
ncbi:hypothetical protein [Asticcacaulis sp. YBE204]|uniref:hypothetical protein n=1 Tax=Asticcacaulis sp. YBE204 TaxID=1282363 RepID=UPI0003C3D43C|nr:hypothetical protein [Asticcacaulis sp. YBE204]ESQ76902.1 hypothetical protein AEYBE204_18675 [Asticcacaulis sp. YBE204]